MKLVIGFYFLCLAALGQTKFYDLFADGKRLRYHAMKSGVNSYAEYAYKCIHFDGCRPATVNVPFDVTLLKSVIDKKYEDGAMYIGLSDRTGALRWSNGRAATSALDNEIIRSVDKCPACKTTCFKFNFYGRTRRDRCTGSSYWMRGICECRHRTIIFEQQIVNAATFNMNDDVMGAFRLFGSDPLSIKGTIATRSKFGKFHIIIYLNLRDTTSSTECKRAETEKQDTFTTQEEVSLGDYSNEGGSTKEVAQVHADLGEFEFPRNTTATGSIITIEKGNIPKLKEGVSPKYFVVIWQNNRAIGCSGIYSAKLYIIFEEYNKAMFRYATGIGI